MEKRIGLQLYTLRDAMESDFAGALKRVAQLGFQGVEFAGYGGYSAGALRELTTQLELAPVASHVSLDELTHRADAALAYALELGLSYVVCPWLPEEARQTIEDYRRLAKTLDTVGAQFRKQGITLCYHNHAFEFTVQAEDGSYALDELYARSSPEFVQAELDVYWVERAGLDAVRYLEKYAGRCPLIHLKDMSRDEDQAFAEVGEGRLDIRKIIETASANGTKWMFVEQDQCPGDPFDSVTTSMRNLREWGYVQ